MSALPTDEAEDLDLDFINSLPSTLDLALNDNGGNNTYEFASGPTEVGKFFRPRLTSSDPEEVLLRRQSIDALSSVSDTLIDPESPTTRLLQPSYSQKSAQIRRWLIRSGHFWSRNRGLWLVMLSQVFAALMNAATKLLETGEELPPFSVLLIRMGFTAILCTTYMWWKNVEGWPFGKPGVRRLLTIRGVLGFFGIFGMIYSLKYLPLSDATVITFLAPSIAGYASHLLLRSPFTRIQQIASLVALLGVLLIARPTPFFSKDAAEARAHIPPMSILGLKLSSTDCKDTASTIIAKSATDENSPSSQRLIAVGVALFGVLGSGGSYTAIRAIGHRAHPLLSVNYFASCSVIFSMIVLAIGPLIGSTQLTFTLPSSLHQWLWLFFISVTGLIVQWLLTLGVALDTSNRATDMIYTNMLWALLLDKVAFGANPNWTSVIGSLLILSSAMVSVVGPEKASGGGGWEDRSYVESGDGREGEESEGLLLADMRV